MDATTGIGGTTSSTVATTVTSTTRSDGSDSTTDESGPNRDTSSSTGVEEESSSSSDDSTPSGSSSTGQQAACDIPMVAGTVEQTLDVDGLERMYYAVVPDSLDGGTEPAPVIIAYHGTDGTAEYARDNYGITGDQPAIYVYPQAVYQAELEAVAWDVDVDGIDFAFFDAMLVDLASKYCVDEERIHAAGQSNGGFFVNEIGCRRYDVVRAIAPVAAGGPAWHPDCTETMTSMMIHGTADTTVPIETGINTREFWLSANDCSGAPNAPTMLNPCVAYAGCDEPVLWCQHAGDHEWPDFAGPTVRAFFFNF